MRGLRFVVFFLRLTYVALLNGTCFMSCASYGTAIQASVLLNPNAGGRRLFGHPDANNMAGMIRMSRMSLSHEIVDRLQVILHKNRRTRKYLGVHRAPAELSTRGAGVGSPGVNGTGGAGDERGGISGAPTGGRQGAQTVLGGQGIVLTSKQSAPSGGLITQRNSEEDQDGDISLEDAQSSRLRDSGDCAEREVDDIGDNDYSKTLKLKAAQALFRMSLEHGGEVCDQVIMMRQVFANYCQRDRSHFIYLKRGIPLVAMNSLNG